MRRLSGKIQRTDHEALVVEVVHDVLEALALLSDDVRSGYLQIESDMERKQKRNLGN